MSLEMQTKSRHERVTGREVPVHVLDGQDAAPRVLVPHKRVTLVGVPLRFAARELHLTKGRTNAHADTQPPPGLRNSGAAGAGGWGRAQCTCTSRTEPNCENAHFTSAVVRLNSSPPCSGGAPGVSAARAPDRRPAPAHAGVRSPQTPRRKTAPGLVSASAAAGWRRRRIARHPRCSAGARERRSGSPRRP